MPLAAGGINWMIPSGIL